MGARFRHWGWSVQRHGSSLSLPLNVREREREIGGGVWGAVSDGERRKGVCSE